MARGIGTTNFIPMVEKYQRVAVHDWALPEQQSPPVDLGLTFRTYKTFNFFQTNAILAPTENYQTNQFFWTPPTDQYIGAVHASFWKITGAGGPYSRVNGCVDLFTAAGFPIDDPIPGVTTPSLGGSWQYSPALQRIDFSAEESVIDLRERQIYLRAGLQMGFYCRLINTFAFGDSIEVYITLKYKDL